MKMLYEGCTAGNNALNTFDFFSPSPPPSPLPFWPQKYPFDHVLVCFNIINNNNNSSSLRNFKIKWYDNMNKNRVVFSYHTRSFHVSKHNLISLTERLHQYVIILPLWVGCIFSMQITLGRPQHLWKYFYFLKLRMEHNLFWGDFCHVCFFPAPPPTPLYISVFT